jgi:hypothetical protein
MTTLIDELQQYFVEGYDGDEGTKSFRLIRI